MIIIIHGDDVARSREYFLSEKSTFDNPVTLEGKNLLLSDLLQIFEGTMLFSEEKTVFIEDFFSKKPSKDTQDIVGFLTNKKFSGTVYIWEGKEQTKKNLTPFSGTTIKTFKLPQTLFQLLDAIQPGNTKALLRLFHETLASSEPELIFHMLTRQFRLLLAMSDDHGNNIEESKRLAPWQKQKLKKQTGLFTAERLTTLYAKLATIEIQIKTGKSTLSLTEQIDFFLTDI